MNYLLFLCGLPFLWLLDASTRALRGTRRNISLATLCATVFAMGFAYPVNAQTNEWTWMSGTKTPQPSVYGTLGVPSADNLPGNRQSAVSWTDSKGNLWLFGGNGEDSSGKIGYLNDLWTFNPPTDKWVWMGGKSTFDKGFFSSGVSGTLRTPAAVNVPQDCV